MYKIEIDWDFRSPHLQAVTGIVKIDNIDFGRINPIETPGFPVRKERGALGYKNCSALFSRCKPLVDVMVRSYFDGMILSDCSVEWFQNCYRKDNDIFLTMND
jgi:hypothetical protein